MEDPLGRHQPRRKSRLRAREGVQPPRVIPGDFESDPVLDDLDQPPARDPGFEPEDTAPFSADPADGDDPLPEAFRLTRVTRGDRRPRHLLTDWRWLLPLVAVWAGSLFAVYWVTSHRPAPVPTSMTRVIYAEAKRDVRGPVSPQTLGEVDAAYDAVKHTRYVEARRLFSALRDKHPEWPSMAVEAAQACFSANDEAAGQQILGLLTADRLTPDANAALGLHRLFYQDYDLAEDAFAAAVALDPSRPEYFYFWGECLRRHGKPQAAAEKYRSALLRNKYENTESLMQMKLWLAEIQAGQEEVSGTNRQIDAALALPRPTYGALFAAAGRSLKGRRYEEAAAFLHRAQEVTEPLVFRSALFDPAFLEEARRPEIAGFYKGG